MATTCVAIGSVCNTCSLDLKTAEVTWVQGNIEDYEQQMKRSKDAICLKIVTEN